MRTRVFILKIFLFILPIVLFTGYVEYRLNQMPNSYSLKHANLTNQSDSVEVLVTGTSHASYGINPAFFSHKGFNIAEPSQDIYFDSALITKSLLITPKLKLVLLEVNYFSLNYSIPESSEAWRAHFYYKFWNIKDSKWKFYSPANYSLICLYSISEVQRLARIGFDTSFTENTATNGWMKFPVPDNNKSFTEKASKYRVEYHNSLILDNPYPEKTQQCLENTVKYLQKKNISVAFIITPVYISYRKFCDTTILHKNTNFINALCTKYNCRCFDYFTDQRFTISDYYNTDHLNYNGAEKFSKILNTEVIKPLLDK